MGKKMWKKSVSTEIDTEYLPRIHLKILLYTKVDREDMLGFSSGCSRAERPCATW